MCESCVRASCVWEKLCVWETCVWASCVWESCVCERVVCERVVCVCVRELRVWESCVCVCVCVEHLKRCKTSTLIDGIAFSYQVLCHYNEPVLSILPGVYPISFSIAGGVTVDFLVTPTKLWKSTGWKFGRKLLYLQCRSWAHSSRAGGSYVCFLSLFHCIAKWQPNLYLRTSFWHRYRNLSVLKIRFDSLSILFSTRSCPYREFILTLFRVWSSLSSCQVLLKCFCTYDAFHIRICKDVSEQVCDSCWIRQGGMNPSGNTFPGKVLTLWNDLWIYTFELVIRLSKVKQPFTFQLLTRRSSLCWNSFPLYQGLTLFSFHPSVEFVLKRLPAVPGTHLF